MVCDSAVPFFYRIKYDNCKDAGDWMKNWKRYFKDYILERGYGYAMDGAVVNIKETEQGILAEVSGTERYDVFIKLSNDTIRSMSCSCP